MLLQVLHVAGAGGGAPGARPVGDAGGRAPGLGLSVALVEEPRG